MVKLKGKEYNNPFHKSWVPIFGVTELAHLNSTRNKQQQVDSSRGKEWLQNRFSLFFHGISWIKKIALQKLKTTESCGQTMNPNIRQLGVDIKGKANKWGNKRFGTGIT